MVTDTERPAAIRTAMGGAPTARLSAWAAAVSALALGAAEPCPTLSHPEPTPLPAGPLPAALEAALDKLDAQWAAYVQKSAVPSAALSVIYGQRTLFFGVRTLADRSAAPAWALAACRVPRAACRPRAPIAAVARCC